MAYFVIAGKENCLNFTHAVHVAEHFTKFLPNFTYRTITKSETEWPTWLDLTNSLNKWHQTRSPLIWKELYLMGGLKHLIGDLSDFWEYCFDYYGFQTRLSKADLEQIQADTKSIEAKQANFQPSNVTLIGSYADRCILELTIYEIQNTLDAVRIKIYDPNAEEQDEFSASVLIRFIEDFRSVLKGVPSHVSVVATAEEALSGCNLLIIIQDFGQRPDEEMHDWLNRCRQNMLLLATEINAYASRDMRIILNHLGSVCFNGTALMEYCTAIKLTNIVAVTADEGISVIKFLADRVEEKVENFWCPPVWGFCGILSHVALPATNISAMVLKPYKRKCEKLPKGEAQYEIRHLEQRLKIDDDVYAELESRQRAGRGILPKMRCLGSLLKLWYAEKVGDEVISLGICSNGSFGFPPGTCISQPVSLNDKRVWEPLSSFAMSSSTIEKVNAISLEVESLLKKIGLNKEEGRHSSQKNTEFNVFV